MSHAYNTAEVTVTAPNVAELPAYAEAIGEQMAGGLTFTADPCGNVVADAETQHQMSLTKADDWRQHVEYVQQEWRFTFGRREETA
jgi:hypothetical protein